MAREFPQPASDAWTQYKHANENKLGMPRRELFPAMIGAVTDALNSQEFVEWVSRLTGIPGLVADPMLEGGSLHQSGPGGYLNVHTDFSKHHFHPHWHRRVNLILYLNPQWEESWGGSLELWERAPGGGIALRGPVSAPAESCADLHDRRAIAAWLSRSVRVSRGAVAQEPRALLLHRREG